MGDVDLVTGAFGNTGRAITELLEARGRRVRTLTNHPRHDAHRSRVQVLPYSFGDPDRLARALDGVDTFYNTYWMRTGDASGYEVAVARARALIRAAAHAGVRRIVQLSVAHPSLESPYPYFRGKARVEAALADSGVPGAVVRPALIFGGDAVLLNNLAWILRRSPVFGIAGDGNYRVRPVHVRDVAQLCVDVALRDDAVTVDAVGPERPSYRELVTWVRDAVGARSRFVSLPPRLVLAASKGMGALLRDELLTRDELLSTIDGLADTDGPATGSVSLRGWIDAHAAELGRTYLNERRRR
jgi:NADH dehydrogenase